MNKSVEHLKRNYQLLLCETNFSNQQKFNPLSVKTHKMVKYTQAICRQQPANCLSMFGHFMGLALKGLMESFLAKYEVLNNLPEFIFLDRVMFSYLPFSFYIFCMKMELYPTLSFYNIVFAVEQETRSSRNYFHCAEGEVFLEGLLQ